MTSPEMVPVGVAVESEADGLPIFLRDMPAGIHLTAPSKWDARLPAAVPTTWLLDRTGCVRERSMDFTAAEAVALEESIRALVEE